MNFNQYLGKYVCGYLTEKEYPKFAVSGLLDGYDSKYIRILASMNRNDSTLELRKYLNWTIGELNIIIPTKRKASLLYSSGIATEILDNKKDVMKGISEIKNDALSCFDFYAESKKYCFDSIGFEKIYGLFVEYNDLLNVLEPNKKELNTIKNQTLTELKKWLPKLETLHNNV